MSRSSNSLKTSDVITTPIKLKYTSSYDCGTIGAYGIEVLTGRNGPVTVTGSISEETLRYRSIRHLYYSNYLTGSYAVSASAADNFLQSTAASGTLDADLRYFPTESNAKITVISIPRNVYGQQVSRRGFILSSSLYRIVDDGNGNLFDIIQTDIPPYVNNLYYAPIITDWYVYENVENIFHVGNIIYPQGMVIITNPEYQEVFNPDPPTANPDTDTFADTFNPKTLNILANDDSGSGTLNPASVVLTGGDVALFTNNYDGTVTLNTDTPGTYTTNYTVESELGGGCTLESNETTITVYVIAPTTTSTTTTTTTTPDINFTISAGCTAAGIGRVTISNYTGAPSGLYEVSTTTYASQAAALAGSFVADVPPKTYSSVPNGTRWVAVRDAVTPAIIKAKSVVVSCTPTTTVPPTTTTTTTTTPGTTTTTTTVPGTTTTTTTTTTPTTTTSTTTTTTTVQCVTFSSFVPSGPGTLSYSSQNVKINAAEGNTGQTSFTIGTLTIAPGCENTVLNFRLNIANYMNQTGSIICNINGNQGQGSISEVNIQRLGLGQSTTTRTIAQTGSYSVNLTGTFGAFATGGDVSSVSFVEVYK